MMAARDTESELHPRLPASQLFEDTASGTLLLDDHLHSSPHSVDGATDGTRATATTTLDEFWSDVGGLDGKNTGEGSQKH